MKPRNPFVAQTVFTIATLICACRSVYSVPNPNQQVPNQQQAKVDLVKGDLGSLAADSIKEMLPSPQADQIAIVAAEPTDVGPTSVVTTEQDLSLALYNQSTGARVWSHSLRENFVHALAFSGNGRWVAVAGLASPPIQRREEANAHGVVRVFETKTGRARAQLVVAPRGFIHALALSPTAPILAASGHSWIEFWNYSTGKRLGNVGMKGEVTSLMFSPEGTKLASAALWSGPTLWDVKTRRRLFDFPYQGNQTFGVAFAPDGQSLALAGSEFASFYNVKTKKSLWKTTTYYGFAPSYLRSHGVLSFSPDSRFLAVGGNPVSALLDSKAGKILASQQTLTNFRFNHKGELWGVLTHWSIESRSSSVNLMKWPTSAAFAKAATSKATTQ